MIKKFVRLLEKSSCIWVAIGTLRAIFFSNSKHRGTDDVCIESGIVGYNAIRHVQVKFTHGTDHCLHTSHHRGSLRAFRRRVLQRESTCQNRKLESGSITTGTMHNDHYSKCCVGEVGDQKVSLQWTLRTNIGTFISV